jgi:hypothetical protein
LNQIYDRTNYINLSIGKAVAQVFVSFLKSQLDFGDQKQKANQLLKFPLKDNNSYAFISEFEIFMKDIFINVAPGKDYAIYHVPQVAAKTQRLPLVQGGLQEYLTSRKYNMIDIFCKHIEHCFKLSVNLQYYSPYFSLCQSSGYGKTRLIAECRSKYKVVRLYLPEKF